MVIAHKILIAVYQMLRAGTDFRDLGADYLNRTDARRAHSSNVWRSSATTSSLHAPPPGTPSGTGGEFAPLPGLGWRPVSGEAPYVVRDERPRQGNVLGAAAHQRRAYAWFAEGFDTRDLLEARALLEESG